MASIWTKSDLIKQWVHKQTEPFDIEQLQKSVSVKASLSTIYKVLDTMPLKYVKRRWSGDNFYRLYFPLGTPDETIRQWLNERTKTGKSKSKIFGYKDSNHEPK